MSEGEELLLCYYVLVISTAICNLAYIIGIAYCILGSPKEGYLPLVGKLKPTLLTFPPISLPPSGLQVDPREPYIIASSYIFSSFPHRLSHIINYVDCFGANGSGFTNSTTCRIRSGKAPKTTITSQ